MYSRAYACRQHGSSIDWSSLLKSSVASTSSSFQLSDVIRDEDSNKDSNANVNKLVAVGSALLASLESRPPSQWLTCRLSAWVKLGRMDRALQLLAGGPVDLLDAGFRHLLYLADVHGLYNCALGTYDLELALLVAQRTRRDPKDYVSLLQQLDGMGELERRGVIDLQLARYPLAVANFTACGLEHRFETALRLAKERRLFATACLRLDRDRQPDWYQGSTVALNPTNNSKIVTAPRFLAREPLMLQCRRIPLPLSLLLPLVQALECSQAEAALAEAGEWAVEWAKAAESDIAAVETRLSTAWASELKNSGQMEWCGLVNYQAGLYTEAAEAFKAALCPEMWLAAALLAAAAGSNVLEKEAHGMAGLCCTFPALHFSSPTLRVRSACRRGTVVELAQARPGCSSSDHRPFSVFSGLGWLPLATVRTLDRPGGQSVRSSRTALYSDRSCPPSRRTRSRRCGNDAAQFAEQRDRLIRLRTEREARAAGAGRQQRAGAVGPDDDAFSDAGSTVSRASSASLTSASSGTRKSRRKAKRKLETAGAKPGHPLEELGLLNSLADCLARRSRRQTQARQLCAGSNRTWRTRRGLAPTTRRVGLPHEADLRLGQHLAERRRCH
uniref:TPR_REGION domain-containing protein n=1 Tax=Macrostomum lignano TaxID=282301 RepID=A0A1I8J023_9PLAT